MPLPKAAYLATEIKEAVTWFKGSLVGLGNAVFNNNPSEAEPWFVLLIPSDSSMLLSRGGNTFKIPLDCDGSGSEESQTGQKETR